VKTEAPAPLLSIIVVTRDRAEELRTISLPSLARQDTRGVELIVWDASEDDLTQKLVEAFAADHPDFAVRYFKAPRAGSCAQRNDAVRKARGEIVFFIDDDSEVSPDGVAALLDMFARQQALIGGGLPLDYRWPLKDGRLIGRTHRFTASLVTTYNKVFNPWPRLSGLFPAIPPNVPGPVDHLFGCDMAFRISVFRDHVFDERLQKFSGYGLWEDQLLSYQLHQEGFMLCIADKGFVVHRAGSGDRGGKSFRAGQMDGYNAGIVWSACVFPYVPWSIIPFLWSRVGFLFVVLLPCIIRPWQTIRWSRMAGYLAGLWTFAVEGIRGIKSGVSNESLRPL